MNLALGSRNALSVGKTALIAALVMLIAFGSAEARAAGTAGPTNCDTAISQMNKSLVLIAKRRIAVRVAKAKGAKQLRRAKRNLKSAVKQGNQRRAAIAVQCAGGSSVSALDAKCLVSIDTLSKSIDLRYSRSLRYKKLKVKGSKKARAKALKRKRAMKTQLKKLDEQIKWQGQQIHKTCGSNTGNGNGTGNGTGNNNGNGNDVDTTPPGAITITGPEGPTNDNTPTVGLDGGDGTGHFECKINNGAYQTVTSPFTIPTLPDGTYTITCRYVDGAGNAGPETSITITIDTTAPGSVTITGPNGPTSDNTPQINLSGAGQDEHYECKIDDGEFEPVVASFDTPELEDGSHTITCRIVDAAGNVGPESSLTVEVDTTPPAAVSITGPSGPTNDSSPTVGLDGGDGTGHYECKINDGEYQTVSAPFTLPDLPDGTYTITCRYVDGAGNTGPETSITITIDTTPPGAVILSGPSGTTNDDTPTYVISGGGAGATYECKIDGGDYAPVTSPYTTAPLGQGAHTVTCRAVDAAGNTGPATTSSITVDSIGPVMTIADGTPKWDGTHSFTLAANEPGATFKCKIDGGTYATVSTSFTSAVLSNGSHTVTCRATDAAGNVGDEISKSFGVFKDPTTVTKVGGFQWGLGCTFGSTLNQLLGCPDASLTITIPANPNGLTGNYLADVSGYIKKINSLFGTYTKYTMSITVDGTAVATDDATIWFNICGLVPVNLDAAKTNISLAAASPHSITIRLKTSAAIDLLPSVQSSGLSVSIHH